MSQLCSSSFSATTCVISDHERRNNVLLKSKNTGKLPKEAYRYWQGHKDLNPEPTVLETAALPIELYPYLYGKADAVFVVGLQGFEPGTIRL